MTHRQCIKQVLHADCRSFGAGVGSSLGDFPIVVQHQSSANACRHVAGRYSDITERECQGRHIQLEMHRAVGWSSEQNTCLALALNSESSP